MAPTAAATTIPTAAAMPATTPAITFAVSLFFVSLKTIFLLIKI
jgi:hypothetical protein